MKVDEIVKKYAQDKSHLKSVSRLSLLFFQKIKPFFIRLENYDNEDDLALLRAAAMLHDIGISFEKAYNKPHHKAGCEFILNNKPEDIKEEDIPTLACLVRYHRKSLPNENKHEIYKKLNQKQKAKVKFLGSIIKLVDAFDFSHIDLIEDFEVQYDKNFNVLTLFFSRNIMLNEPFINAINEKKDFFEMVYQTRVELKGF